MSERFKYANNGVYECRNFEQFLATRIFPDVPIGSAALYEDWHITFQMDNRNYVYPFIFCSDKPPMNIRWYFNFKNKGGYPHFESNQSDFLKGKYGCSGKDVRTDRLLNENNGYLDNGAVSVEYGFQVEGILGEDKIWKFNFDDEFFDWEEQENMVKCKYLNLNTDRKRTFYCHKQPITFHSSKKKRNVINILVEYGASTQLEKCLQIAHGVRIQLHDPEYFQIIVTARNLNLSNVVHYCEQQSIRLSSACDIDLKEAIELNLRHYLAFLMKNVDILKYWMKKLKELDIDKMSGETMKMLVAKMLEKEI